MPTSVPLSGWPSVAPPPTSLAGSWRFGRAYPGSGGRSQDALCASDWKTFYSPLVSTLYWLKFSPTPLLSTPVRLVVPFLKNSCLVAGSNVIPPMNSTLGFGTVGGAYAVTTPQECQSRLQVSPVPPPHSWPPGISYSYWLQALSVDRMRAVIGRRGGSCFPAGSRGVGGGSRGD